MQTVRWTTFCVSNSLTRTLVHFLPSARNVTAPYPAQCRLTLFGAGVESRSVILDGARLRQPDGVRLEEAFPVLQEEPPGAMCGLSIELSALQPRLDLSPSACVIELVSNSQSVRFRPLCLDENRPVSQMLGLSDKQSYSTLVVVNLSQNPVDAPLTSEQQHPAGRAVAPLSVKEFVVCDRQSFLQSDIEGGFHAARLPFKDTVPADVACFAVYRARATKMPVSICAL